MSGNSTNSRCETQAVVLSCNNSRPGARTAERALLYRQLRRPRPLKPSWTLSSSSSSGRRKCPEAFELLSLGEGNSSGSGSIGSNSSGKGSKQPETLVLPDWKGRGSSANSSTNHKQPEMNCWLTWKSRFSSSNLEYMDRKHRLLRLLFRLNSNISSSRGRVGDRQPEMATVHMNR